jgi:hypothetical protein
MTAADILDPAAIAVVLGIESMGEISIGLKVEHIISREV